MIKDHTIDQCLVELARTMAALKALRGARKSRLLMCPNCYQTRPFAQTRCEACGNGNREQVVRFDQREHAAALRASLDLTRKLADLRQGR